MAFIIKNRDRYFELVENRRVNGKHKRFLLYYMGAKLIIPYKVIEKLELTPTNLEKLKSKHPKLKIEH